MLPTLGSRTAKDQIRSGRWLITIGAEDNLVRIIGKNIITHTHYQLELRVLQYSGRYVMYMFSYSAALPQNIRNRIYRAARSVLTTDAARYTGVSPAKRCLE